MTEPDLRHGQQQPETWFEEGCWIREWSNDPLDPECSIAHARVPAGSTTRWHRLRGIAERYVVLDGHGRVEIEADGQTLDQRVGPGDVVRIPPGARQRIRAEEHELAFLAVCTPRFRPETYIDDESEA